jgi:hypothetical protein
MLRRRNTPKRGEKMGFLRLTLLGGLASLQRRWEGFGVTARGVFWACFGVLGLAVSGCATLTANSPPAEKEKVASQRAQARWDLLLKGDVDGAYQYLSEGSKAVTPLAIYKTKVKPGIWRAAQVAKVDCEAEVCKVEMTITYDFRDMKGIQTPVPETWIIEKGSAWYIYRQ